jgi:hypothetical protein
MRSATSCLAALVLAAVFRLAAADTTWEGRKLSDYLDFLNRQGSKVIYTSDLVADDMLLSREPAGDASADGLADLLHAFGCSGRCSDTRDYRDVEPASARLLAAAYAYVSRQGACHTDTYYRG